MRETHELSWPFPESDLSIYEISEVKFNSEQNSRLRKWYPHLRAKLMAYSVLASVKVPIHGDYSWHFAINISSTTSGPWIAWSRHSLPPAQSTASTLLRLPSVLPIHLEV